MTAPFKIGSVVRYVKLGSVYEEGAAIGSLHLIVDVENVGNGFVYATDSVAWIQHECFEFVRECTDEDMVRYINKQELE